MRTRAYAIVISFALLLGGCATAPQRSIGLEQHTLSPNAGRVGVAMAPLPKVDTFFPGANCLLCIAAASMVNSGLTAHTKTLPPEGLPDLKREVAELIRKKGVDATVIEEPLDLAALPDFGTKGPDVAKKDFGSLRAKHEFDKLLVINITGLGIVRPYANYFPTSAPEAVFTGVGYLVDLPSNRYEWYAPVVASRKAEGEWDEPPKFPGLTNAYFQALEMGRDGFLRPFSN